MSARLTATFAVRVTAMGLLVTGSAASAQADGDGADAPAVSGERGQSAEELIARGEVQVALDQIDAAETSFLEGIEQIIDAQGEFASSLIDGYRGLAEVFARRGEFAEAVAVLEQARHVSHRNYGLFNLDQAEILDELSQILEAAGDTRQAHETQREILDVATRHFGADDAGMIPYHLRLAAFYEAARMRGLAREQHERALDILEDDPATAPELYLEPLSELLRIDTILGEPRRSQRRLEEALAAAPDARPQLRAEALATMADAELARGETETAIGRYKQAYAALAWDGAAAADAFFEQPRMISFIPPPGPVDWGGRSEQPYDWGSITLRFSLSAAGRAQRIRVVVADPPGLMDSRYVRRLREAVFRPRLKAGEPVATPRMRYVHEFRYFVAEAD